MPAAAAGTDRPTGTHASERAGTWVQWALGPEDARFAGLLFLVLALAVTTMTGACGPRPEAYPTSDYALLELCVRLAAEGSQRLGPEARFYFQHPGPSFFYAAVPVYQALGGGPAALGMAALLWNLLALLVLVRCAARLAPGTGPYATALLVMALLATRGLGWLQSYWNANLPVLPLAVVLLASARMATAEGRALPIVVLFGSLAVQSHIVWAVPVALVSLAGLAACVSPSLRTRLGVPTRGRGLRALTVLAALAIAVPLWALPLVDELFGDYHNLQRILTNLGRSRPNPWSQALPAAADALLGFAGVSSVPPASASAARLAASLALVAATALAGWRAARRRAGTAALAVVTTAGLGAVVLTARSAPGALRFDYVLHWASVVGVCAGIVVVTELLDLVPRLGAHAVTWAGRATLLLVALLLVLDQIRDLRARPAPARDPAAIAVERAALAVRQKLPALQPRLPVGTPPPRFLLRVGRGADRDAALGLILALDRMGTRFAVEPFGPYRLDGRLKPRGDELGELQVGDPPTAGTRIASGSRLDLTWQPPRIPERAAPPRVP